MGIEKLIFEAKEGKGLVELTVIGKEYPVSGRVIKYDALNRFADIERFGAVTRIKIANIQKFSIPKYERKSPLKMNKYEESIFTKCLDATIDRVMELYEEHSGNPDESLTVDCPMCEQATTNYFCAWTINKHVHFHCPNCKFGFIQ